ILHHKVSFILGLLSVVVAAGVFVAEITLLDVHDIETRNILAEKEQKTREEMRLMEDDYRKIMKELGFNLLILPKGQRLDNFYAESYASKFMPEEYVEKLAGSDIMTIRHLLPSLEQKIRWPEQGNRTIILNGTRGEVPFLHLEPKEPILVSVSPGKIVLGYEIWNSLGLKQGDTVRLLESDFQVSKCHPQRGNKDDITAWIDLKKAQKLLNHNGKINAILALKCHCEGSDISSIRNEIAQILPETQVIEFENKVVVREKARDRAKAAADSALAAEHRYRTRLRHEREAFAAWLIPLVIIGSTALIGLLAYNNVSERRPEIGILRALGLKSQQIFYVFLAKAFMIGFLGGCLGYSIGFMIGLISSGVQLELETASNLFKPGMLVIVIVSAPFMSSIASWVPALIAARQDPAVILREE
ncbi:MAG TPA: FtsX-like permease family protein, partial [bacterium]|nr:FtsX-like permease family protein [bacterium]